MTRSDLSEHVKAAFENGPATRANLIDAALDSRAPREVLVLLSLLPNRRFLTVNELWNELPIGA